MSDETKHPERRAGQRWRLDWNSGATFERTLLSRRDHGGWNVSDDKVWSDSYWDGDGCTMTLLADTPATPQSSWEAELAVCNPSDILRDPAIPERIVKPPMAHSMGVEDPTLPEAR